MTGLKSHLAKCHKNISDVYLKRTAKNDENERERVDNAEKLLFLSYNTFGFNY